MTKFQTTLEARQILTELRKQTRSVPYNKDLRKLLDNCELLMIKMGNAEVLARQSHKPKLVEQSRDELARAMDYAEKMILLAKLLQ
jgi:hypothetical protein